MRIHSASIARSSAVVVSSTNLLTLFAVSLGVVSEPFLVLLFHLLFKDFFLGLVDDEEFSVKRIVLFAVFYILHCVFFAIEIADSAPLNSVKVIDEDSVYSKGFVLVIVVSHSLDLLYLSL